MIVLQIWSVILSKKLNPSTQGSVTTKNLVELKLHRITIIYLSHPVESWVITFNQFIKCIDHLPQNTWYLDKLPGHKNWQPMQSARSHWPYFLWVLVTIIHDMMGHELLISFMNISKSCRLTVSKSCRLTVNTSMCKSTAIVYYLHSFQLWVEHSKMSEWWKSQYMMSLRKHRTCQLSISILPSICGVFITDCGLSHSIECNMPFSNLVSFNSLTQKWIQDLVRGVLNLLSGIARSICAVDKRKSETPTLTP